MVTGVITQNVDLLHTKAGSTTVVDLHGTYARVVCLECGHTMTRAALAEQLEALNPGFVERAEAVGGIAVAPDADAMVSETASFRYVDCPRCGGMLKPDIVYFGESVPKPVVERAYSLVADADALLVAGSSLTVFSGLRFVRQAAAVGTPVAIINRGPTRGDELATVKVDGGLLGAAGAARRRAHPRDFGAYFRAESGNARRNRLGRHVNREIVGPRLSADHVGDPDVPAFELPRRSVDEPVLLGLPMDRLPVEDDDPHLAGFELASLV